MSDRQQSEEPEEQLDLEGDDDVMDDDDGYRRNRRRADSEEEPEEEYEENDERQGEGDGDGDDRGEDDAGMAADGEEAAADGGGDEMDKEGDDGPEDAEEKKKWDELLALPPHGSEVFIGGLPRNTTEEDLRELCEPLGEIYEVRLSKDKDTKESKGFAFVTFTDKDAAQRAVEDVQDREYKVKTIYVKNLPENVSKEKVKELFEKHGEVTKVVLPPAKAGHKRDFGFVHFAERSSALKAVKGSEKYEIDGQALEVSMAKPLSDKKPDHSHRPGGGPSYPRPPYGGGHMGDPYGSYGGGPAFNQPMIYGRGLAPAGMRMVPMVLPDGRLGYVLQQPGGMPPPPPPRRGDRRDSGRGGDGGHSRRYRPY
ncbi:hypothetical protein EJB05_10143 [Eragrostis curvula]|uniref:RRM domain-containing protein n=1 Tax=Eragrostis curvula TaxID=38414 RepID=A0A5J9W6S5_9POAL|nr:hypothetical protein EJB05_10143 [Eragrostis curvula]